MLLISRDSGAVDISKGYFYKPIGSSKPLCSATERENSSRFPRSVEVVSQNATLPVAFSSNDGADKLSRPSRTRDAARSIRHQIIIAAQNGLDVECGAGRGVGISSARGQHT
jgi:hypothetical protein